MIDRIYKWCYIYAFNFTESAGRSFYYPAHITLLHCFIYKLSSYCILSFAVVQSKDRIMTRLIVSSVNLNAKFICEDWDFYLLLGFVL